MYATRPIVAAFIVVLASCSWASAGQNQATQSAPSKPATQQDQPQQDVTYKETVVVSASKTEQQLVNAPATMTVIGARALELAPSTNYADILRSVPGLNITQISARDINLTSRAATSSLATSQLAVLDGRSLYQDFFGFVMWDFMPVNLGEIKRIEVIRGPASAVWGANALNGVINVITKTPREMQGTTFTMGVGGFNKEVNDNHAASGSLFYLSGTHARAVNDRLAFEVSAGTYTSEALARRPGSFPMASRTTLSTTRPTTTLGPRSRSSMRASTTTWPTARSWRFRAALQAPTASCTAASGRSTS